MKIYNDINNVKIKNPFVTVGTFDGVHLGHQHIFNKLKDIAKKHHGESVVITFWPHPRMVLNHSDDQVLMINTIDEKIELIEKQGIDHFIILPFTTEFSKLSSRDFIDTYLHKILNINGLIVGYDHRFGKDRLGNFDVLKECAKKYNFIIEKINAFDINGEKISSTIIRNQLLNGEVEHANKYLSRNFALSGKVTNGYRIGRNLGFPTANVQPESPYKLIPRDGVYAVQVIVENKIYSGMLNIGLRPTFNENNNDKSIEVHIIGFDGDLYGDNIKIVFHKRIRNEMKFNSIEELVAQLKNDKIQIEAYFDAP
ncbi:MAG: bifunctional riboflavin kinase/FAD synthetase [Bacteroidales bacterium]|nr:bifunctional riboflavin kinase/FAD synthetase [Bacteroidales bacterium]